MKTTLFEYLQKDYDKFPLAALVKQAKKFKDFKEFSNFYSNEIYHGYYWHLTKDKDFKYSINSGSRDMSSMSDGENKTDGSFMVTSHLDYWDEYYNTNPRTWKRDIKRGYVVLFDASDIDPKYLVQVSRGFGNEVYLDKNNAIKLKQVGIYGIKYARQLDKKFHNMIPQSKEELYDLWIFAQKTQTI